MSQSSPPSSDRRSDIRYACVAAAVTIILLWALYPGTGAAARSLRQRAVCHGPRASRPRDRAPHQAAQQAARAATRRDPRDLRDGDRHARRHRGRGGSADGPAVAGILVAPSHLHGLGAADAGIVGPDRARGVVQGIAVKGAGWKRRRGLGRPRDGVGICGRDFRPGQHPPADVLHARRIRPHLRSLRPAVPARTPPERVAGSAVSPPRRSARGSAGRCCSA